MDETDVRDIIEATRRLVRERVLPLEQQIDETDEMPPELRRAAADMGLYGFAIPEVYGGLGMSAAQEARLAMELGYTTPAFRSLFGTNNGIAGHVLLEGGTDKQKAEYLPRLASGEWTSSFALTEAEAGSDPAGLTTSARRSGDGYVLNGSEAVHHQRPRRGSVHGLRQARRGTRRRPATCRPSWCPRARRGSPSGRATARWASTARGPPRSSSMTCVSPADALVGGIEGEGYRTAMRCLAHGRLHIAALCVGMAQRLLEETVSYALQRRQSGHPIAEFQLIQGMIADSQTDVYAGRALVLVGRGRVRLG